MVLVTVTVTLLVRAAALVGVGDWMLVKRIGGVAADSTNLVQQVDEGARRHEVVERLLESVAGVQEARDFVARAVHDEQGVGLTMRHEVVQLDA